MQLLVPVDFSTSSEAALLHACGLSNCMAAAPLVMHVVHDPGNMPGYYAKALAKRSLLGRLEDGAADMLDEFLGQACEKHEEIRRCNGMETLLVRGLPTTRIVEIAEQREVRMIVMGSQGRTGLKHLMMGSIAEQVVRLSSVPVTVVKT